MEDNKDILEYLKNRYNIIFTDIKKIKGTYKLLDKDKNKYALKVVKYNFGHFYFILSAILHLQRNNYNHIPKIIKTKNKELYIKFNNYYAFLSEWIEGHICNYDNQVELEKAIINLANMHIKSKNFLITDKMNPRIYWFSWIKFFSTRKNEILDFEKRIEQKANKSKFDLYYKDNIKKQLEIADNSINGLINSNYINIMERHVKKLEFCHHDYANHNLVLDNKNNIFLIDFDYCILDRHLHDLSSIIIRTMKNGRWNSKRCSEIIKKYSSIYPINQEEIEVMKYFIMFPQEFWQIGIQKYWEQQPYEEKRYMEKITGCINDFEKKHKFLHDFF